MATDMVTNAARAEVLRRIREAKGGVASAEAVRAGWSAIERKYQREATRPREAVLELLEDRLRDYDARVVRAGHSEVAAGAAEGFDEELDGDEGGGGGGGEGVGAEGVELGDAFGGGV